MDNSQAGPATGGQPDAGTLDAAVAAEVAAMEAQEKEEDNLSPADKARREEVEADRRRKFLDTTTGLDAESQDEGPETDSSQDDEQPDADNPEAEDDAPQDDGETLEVEAQDGKRYRVPKALEGELMMRADYSRKTAELAQDRQRIAEERQFVRQLYEVNPAFQAEMAEYYGLRGELDALVNKTNWGELEATDVTEFNRRAGRISLVQQRMGQLERGLQQKHAQVAQLDERAQAEQAQAAAGVLKQIWPEYTRDDGDRLARFAQDVGVKAENIQALRMGADPVALRLLDFAYRYVDLMRNKPAAEKKAAQARPMVKPGAVQGVNRGTAPVEKFSQRLKRSGSAADAIALELAHMQRQERRRK